MLKTLLEFAIVRSNPIVGSVLTIGKYYLNKTKETPKMINGNKSNIGIGVAFVGFIAQLLGYDVPIEASSGVESSVGQIITAIGGLITSIGLVHKAEKAINKK